MLRRRRRQEARGDGSSPIVFAIVVVIAIFVAAAGGEVADMEDVQRCNVLLENVQKAREKRRGETRVS